MAGRGDPEHNRFKAMYDDHYPAVLRYAARRVGVEAARDIAADTFLAAWRRLDRVPAGAPLPWPYATARKCLASELRRRDRRERLDSRIRAEAMRGQNLAGPDLLSGWQTGLRCSLPWPRCARTIRRRCVCSSGSNSTSVSASAAVLCLVKPGERVAAGQSVLELRADDESRFAPAREALAGAVEIGPEPPEATPLVIERVGT